MSARNASLLTFPLLLVCCRRTHHRAIERGNYQISYVWSVTEPEHALHFTDSRRLWGSQEGSILFWSLLMSLFAFGALLLNWRSHRRLMPYVIAYTMATLAFFIGLSLFIENPFERFWIVGNNEVVQTALIPTGATAPSNAFAWPRHREWPESVAATLLA